MFELVDRAKGALTIARAAIVALLLMQIATLVALFFVYRAADEARNEATAAKQEAKQAQAKIGDAIDVAGKARQDAAYSACEAGLLVGASIGMQILKQPGCVPPPFDMPSADALAPAQQKRP